MSSRNMQNLFHRYPIIVVNGHPTHLECNLTSLEEWGNPDELRVMHGASL
jgi:hypothetical protein